MSLPIRYSPMAFYFRLSIVFLTLQVLRHLLRWCDLLRPSRDCHWLYPIPIAPSVQYHIGDLSYDLWTTSLHFPFLVFSLLSDTFLMAQPITDHHTVQSGPYHTLRRTRTLCSFYLLFVFKTFVSTPKKKEVFPQNSDLSSSCLIISLCSIFALSHLHSIPYFWHPLPYRTIPHLRLTLLRTPWYYIRRPFHCSRITPLRTT